MVLAVAKVVAPVDIGSVIVFDIGAPSSAPTVALAEGTEVVTSSKRTHSSFMYRGQITSVREALEIVPHRSSTLVDKSWSRAVFQARVPAMAVMRTLRRARSEC